MLRDIDLLFEEEEHIYTKHGRVYESVTQKIKKAGLSENFGMVSAEVMDAARQRGKLVHMACEFYNEGVLNLDSVHESIRGYVLGYIRFRKECNIEICAVEQRLCADITPMEGTEDVPLAATPDLVCIIDGIRAVVDLKTSQTMNKPMGIQTAGYRFLWNYIHKLQPIEQRFGLKLKPNADYKLVEHTDPDDRIAFWDCLMHPEDDALLDPWRIKYTKGVIHV